jgi:hypothetical protein
MSDMIIATGDCETDPFEFGLIPKPFVWGFYSEAEGYCSFWGEGQTREEQERSCHDQFIEFLYQLEKPHMIYMHNGGKFDFIFLLSDIEGSLKIVNGRILEARIGPHIIRDSYAAVPIPLGAYKKDDIDYNKLSFEVRQKNKSEILHYLGGDVRYLHEMMIAYREEFGNVLTIGTAAMRALKGYHEFEEFNSEQDTFFRRFYYGGRNQCFDTGIVKGDFKVYDVNSMYPFCMQSMLHPVSATYSETRSLSADTDFVVVTGWNYGALPFKDEKLHILDFTREYGTYHCTGHELRAGLDTGTFKIDRIESAYTFSQRVSFADFVDAFYAKRLDAKASGLDLYVLFYKLILNSGYGKFCLNSDNFKDWQMTAVDEFLDVDQWTLEIENGEYLLWSKPASQTKFYNVATGASITGAARSQLLRGLANADRPVYCDTDSIICEQLRADSDTKRLGAWKLESEGDEICIAGKKLYALYKDGKVVTDDKGKPKQASKGARLSADQIRNAAMGGVELFQNPVPAFKLDGDHQFISRRIRKTGVAKPFAWNKP